MKLTLSVFVLALCVQAKEIPLTGTGLDLKNADAQPVAYHGKSALKLVQKTENADGFAIVRGTAFRNGVIEVEVSGAPGKGAGDQARGFIGVGFRVQGDGARFENIYIRPTNGRADDQLRRNHSLQYESIPDWPWHRLRESSPGVYESYADLVTGEWTRLRIVVHGTNASLFVGDAAQPSLVVHDLKLGDSEGAVALWVGPGTEGYFRDLKIYDENDKGPSYGSEDSAGHYVQTPDAKIYYERYGEGGIPLVLLHGGEYGYIDEFGDLIREMSKSRMVIAIATRGYGRSERGTVPLSHRQFAQDASAVMKDVFRNGEKVDVLGFSEGAITSYLVAAGNPGMVRRLIAISGGLGPYGETLESVEAAPLTPEGMQKDVPDLVALRKKVMPHPEQFELLIRELDQMYRTRTFVKQSEVKSINAPTLIMAGDKDYYNRLDALLDIYHLIPKAQMSVIPGCGHVVLDCKANLVIELVTSFLDQPEK